MKKVVFATVNPPSGVHCRSKTISIYTDGPDDLNNIQTAINANTIRMTPYHNRTGGISCLRKKIGLIEHLAS